MKTILYQNEGAITRTKSRVKLAQPILQKVVDEFYKLKLPIKLDDEKLRQLIDFTHGQLPQGETNVSMFIKNELTATVEPQKIFGIPLSQRKVVDLMQLPSFSQLEMAIALCKAGIDFHDDRAVDYLRYFELKDNKLEFAKKNEEALVNNYTSYANTETQLNLVAAHNAAATALEALNRALMEAAGLNIWADDKFERLFIVQQGKEIKAKASFYYDNMASIRQKESA
jgi:hypothetical protein